MPPCRRCAHNIQRCAGFGFSTVVAGQAQLSSAEGVSWTEVEVDAGSEFKGVTRKYFEDHNVIVKVAKEGRSRQVGLVERRNQEIGSEIFTNQLVKEIETNKINKKWLKDISGIIAEMNIQHEVK